MKHHRRKPRLYIRASLRSIPGTWEQCDDEMGDTGSMLRQKLLAGKVAFGTCIDSHSPATIEVAAYSGLDFVRIDYEHSWQRGDSPEHLMRAAHIGGIAALHRVDNDENLIRKALEAGAEAVIVPHVRDESDVKDIVSAAKFPPVGKRGYGSISLSGRWGTGKAADWIASSNTQLMVGVMIEEPEAIEKIDDITSVPGLDFLLFGPSDLSTILGMPGQTSHPKVHEALEKTVKSAKKNGKHVMIGANYPWEEKVKQYTGMGCTLIELGHELPILYSIWHSSLERLKTT